MVDLFKQQNQLQKQAYQVLKKLNLVEILSRFGKPNIIGSLNLGLMTWRDIDIEVIVEKIDLGDITEIVSNLILQGHKRIDFGVTDNRGKDKTPRTPTGIYLGIKYFGDDIKPKERFGRSEKVWKIDIHFVLPRDSQAIQKTKELASKLTEEKKKAILEIKKEVTKSPKHRKEIFTIDVYNAVLNHGVKSLEKFKKFLGKRGKEL